MSKPRAKTCRYHCVACDRHFASLRAYDDHKDRQDGRNHLDVPIITLTCTEPANAPGKFTSRAGRCDLSVPPKPVTLIWAES